MADEYYVLKSDGRRVTQVIIRFDVPVGSNAVGTLWQTAAAEQWAGLEVQSVEWPGRSSTDLADGAVVEMDEPFVANVNRPGVAAELVAWVSDTVTDAKARLSNELDFWGKTGSV